MKNFINPDFLLSNTLARQLYHQYAENLPIIDYHCHLNPEDIAKDTVYDNLTSLWLGGDHYKWRLMRANGISEKFITGEASPKEKFMKWAETVSQCIGNPVYLWTQLELKRYFDIDLILNSETAEEIWQTCNNKLQRGELSVRKLIEQSKVEIICTTDDPVDSLKFHRTIAENPSIKVQVLPAFRPDKGIKIDLPSFLPWLRELERVVGSKIQSIWDLQMALDARVEYFKHNGCVIADHGLDILQFSQDQSIDCNRVFQKALAGDTLSLSEIAVYQTEMLLFLAKTYAKHKWVMQLHLNTLRNCNTPMFQKLGPDSGYDCMGSLLDAKSLVNFFDALQKDQNLPKTILYSLNPNDLPVLMSVLGCFQEGPVMGKLQLGSAWWFNDHKAGILEQMQTLANQGILGNFIGMLTDSRSFLSYTRHEYFRRILCNLIGNWGEKNEIPSDLEYLGKIVQKICYSNAKQYFFAS